MLACGQGGKGEDGGWRNGLADIPEGSLTKSGGETEGSSDVLAEDGNNGGGISMLKEVSLESVERIESVGEPEESFGWGSLVSFVSSMHFSIKFSRDWSTFPPRRLNIGSAFS